MNDKNSVLFTEIAFVVLLYLLYGALGIIFKWFFDINLPFPSNVKIVIFFLLEFILYFH